MNTFHKDIEGAFDIIDKNRDGVFYGKIVDHLCISPAYANEDRKKLADKVWRYLNSCVNKNILYQKVKNGKKYKGKISYKSGYYKKIKAKEELPLIQIDANNTQEKFEQTNLFGQKEKLCVKNKPHTIKQKVQSDDATPAHIGKGGEYAVMSELLYNGYYTSLSSVDDGIDIVAHKNQNVFFIQVKTTIVKNNSFDFKIKKESYDRYNITSMFYIFVLRSLENEKVVSLYIVFPTKILEHYIDKGSVILSHNEYNVRFRQQGKRVLLVGGGHEDDIVNSNLNRFDLIKP